MGLTGKESQWLQLCLDTHSLFCTCGDPEAHLTKCLMVHTAEERDIVAAMADTAIGDNGEPENTATGPGDAADHATAG
ncbi:ORF2 [torque teno Delphinidae virus 23]